MNQNATAPAQANAASSHPHAEEHDHDHSLEWVDLMRIGLVALACLASWLGLGEHFAGFDVIALVATLAGGLQHPLAKAILEKAGKLSLGGSEPEHFEYVPGKGIVCSVGGEQIIVGNRGLLALQGIATTALAPAPDHASEVLVARRGRLLGSLHIADALRAESVQAVAELRKMGLRTILLTGDAAAIAKAIGKQLGIDQVEAELLPDEKVACIEALMATGKKVAMIGDGINDAPALTQANVGVAMG